MSASKLLAKTAGQSVRRTLRNSRPGFCEPLEGRSLLSGFTVTNLLDGGPGSLRAAIDAANAAPGADVIEFAGSLNGTIGLSSELAVTDDLTIVGRSLEKVTLSGQGVTRILSVSGADTELSIRGLTIADGLASAPAGTALGGGLLNDGAAVNLDHVSFKANRAVGHIAGGGAVASIGGSLNVSHADFADNAVTCDDGQACFGGAVFNDRSVRAGIDHATFVNNSALGGGANGGAIAVTDGSQLDLAHCAFTANLAQGSSDQYAGGGAIVEQSTGLTGSSGPTVNVSHCSFVDNSARARDTVAVSPSNDARGQAFGGAIVVEFGPVPPSPTPPVPTLVIEYSTFDSNTAQARSGGSGAAGAAGRIGAAAWGGAVHNVSSSLVLRHSRFSDNLARGGDGGLGGSGAGGGAGGFAIGGAVVAGTLMPINTSPATEIQGCQFLNNRAVGGNGGTGGAGGSGGTAGRADGGGAAGLTGTMTIDDSAIANNSALGGAGGAGATVTAGGDGGLARGGGLASERGSVTTVNRTSIFCNQAIGGAGGVGRAGGDAMGGGVYNGRTAGLPPNPNAPAELTLIDCAVSENLAEGGSGGAAGGNGGNALGGGIANFNPAPPLPGAPLLWLQGTLVTGNSAVGGLAGTGGANGAGVGGGLYNQLTAFTQLDALTSITGNDASSSDDDIFGMVNLV
jgi:hypothetical protein